MKNFGRVCKSPRGQTHQNSTPKRLSRKKLSTQVPTMKSVAAALWVLYLVSSSDAKC